MTKREKAAALNAQGMELRESGKLDEAVEVYKKAIAADRTWSVPLYNLGLVYKDQRRWRQSLDYNRRATVLDPEDEAAWWNLGIAATALARWDVARAAWRGFGIEIPEGVGPVDFSCGFGPIRLNPQGNAEIIWAHRIDPARAVIASIPFPESNHRWRDLVLNDGAPVGYRQYNGREYAVLNEIQLLEPSAFGTYIASVTMPDNQDHVDRLAEIAAEMEGAAEDWSTSVRILCKACSEGRPHEDHDTERPRPEGAHLVGIAARNRRHATRILNAWEQAHPGVRVETLDDGLEAGR
jgi:tetratricopeptide (TPR) repeat protein